MMGNVARNWIRARARHGIAFALVALNLLAVAPHSAAGVTTPAPGNGYTLTELALLDGEEAIANEVAESGQIAGWARMASGSLRAVLWDADGAATDLGTLGGEESVALSINNRGQIVGWAQRPDGGWEAAIWENGAIRGLGRMGAEESIAWGINDAGQIVGALVSAQANRSAAWWSGGSSGGLGSLHGGESFAMAIDGAGRVAGWSDSVEGGFSAVIWRNGAVTELADPFTADTRTGSMASGISGDVTVGYALDESGTAHGVIWQGSDPAALPSLTGAAGWSYATDVNAAGMVAGQSAGPGDEESRAVIWRAGEVIELPALGGGDGAANGINDDGVVVGWVSNAAGDKRPAVWRPSPAGAATPEADAETGATRPEKTDARTATQPEAASTPEPEMVVARGQCQLYFSANTNIPGPMLPEGTALAVVERLDGGWVRVRLPNGRLGFVQQSCLA